MSDSAETQTENTEVSYVLDDDVLQADLDHEDGAEGESE